MPYTIFLPEESVPDFFSPIPVTYIYGDLVQFPSLQVKASLWLPEFTQVIAGITDQFAHGHTACVAVDGAGPGEDILFRARYEDRDSLGVIQWSLLQGADLETPANWESDFTNMVVASDMPPARWFPEGLSNDFTRTGGSLASVWIGDRFRLFYFVHNSGDQFQLAKIDYLPGTGWMNAVSIDLLDDEDIWSLQVAACSGGEVFLLKTKLVELAIEPWQKDTYGSTIVRYYKSGSSWYKDTGFDKFYHLHAEGGLLRDTPREGNTLDDGAGGGVILQWGFRPCGGLAANEIDSNTVVVSFGLTFWKRWGYNTHSQGLHTFIYHRNSELWERGIESGVADYPESLRLHYDSFANGFAIDGKQFVVWNRMREPSDIIQTPNAIVIPRHYETVIAKFDSSGRYLSQFQYLGHPVDLTSCTVVALNHGGQKQVYALGYKAVYESPPAAFLCDVPEVQQIEVGDYCTSIQVSRNNRFGMTLDLSLKDTRILFGSNSILKNGMLITATARNAEADNYTPVGRGLLDGSTPSISLDSGSQAKITASAQKLLADTKAESIEDILPQNTQLTPPNDPIKHVALHEGFWEVAKGVWDTLFFGGTYGMAEKNVYRLGSFPYARTGGDHFDEYDDPDTEAQEGGPGYALQHYRPKYMGSWFKDLVWMAMSPMIDGSIQATVRFGNDYEWPTTHEGVPAQDANWRQDRFKTTGWSSQVDTYQTIHWNGNGLIRGINWRTGSYTGPIWNPDPVSQAGVPWVGQEAVMAGLICHAVELGKKYAFVWEADSNFGVSSHTDDTWKKERFDSADYDNRGPNRLYLLVSDYNDQNKGWIEDEEWLNKSVRSLVATGIEPGKPAELKMQVIGGTIYCYYRPFPLAGNPETNWIYAFSYPAALFGAGKFGIIGRGHAGIHWNELWPARKILPSYDNHVDFWNITLSDNVMDRTLEDVLRGYAWLGHTESEFIPLVDIESVTL